MKWWLWISPRFTCAAWALSASACGSHPATEAGVQAPVAMSSAGAVLANSAPTASTALHEPMPAPSTTSAPPLPSRASSTSPAGKMCGGIAGFRCAEKQYCSFALEAQCGAGDMAGVCKPIPDLCTMEFAPVCGCDGKTYSTACVAARSGASVAKAGACADPADSGIAEGKPCGTRGANGDCKKGLYCAYRQQCGEVDEGGTCTKKPQICNNLVAPVCGCDDQTYPNACYAARAGMNVAVARACKTPAN